MLIMFCPYYKNKEVADSFNELIESLGGKPLTDEEFRSSELRMQRTGLDFSAMECAYRVYNLNNGNFLDLAPNGERSILFDQILHYVNYDRKNAIKLKAQFYSNSFRNKFGDWSIDSNLDNTDVNGEPIFFENVKLQQKIYENDPLKFNFKFSQSTIQDFFGKELGSRLLSGDTVNSNNILSVMINNRSCSDNNFKLLNILSKHSIPVKLYNIDDGSLMSTITDKDGNSVIIINPFALSNVSNLFVGDSLLHELIHAVTVNVLNNPKTQFEVKFAKDTKTLFNTFDKLFPKNLFSRNNMHDGYYILNNVKEFAAVFATDQDARNLLYSKAIAEDKLKNNTVIRLLKNFINSFSRVIVNRNIFNTNKDNLKLYENQFKKFLIQNEPLITKKESASKILNVLYEAMNPVVVGEDQIQSIRQEMLFYLHGIEKNNILDISQEYDKVSNPYKINSKDDAIIKLQTMKSEVSDKFQKMLNAVKSSTLKDEYKSKTAQMLDSQIQQLSTGTLNDFITIGNILSLIIPQINEDFSRLSRIHKNDMSISDSEYMYYKHDHFGAYRSIMEIIKNTLSDDVIKNVLKEQQNEKGVVSLQYGVEEIVRLVSDAYHMCDDACSILDDMLIDNVFEDLKKIGLDTHSPTMIAYLKQLKNIDYDTSSFIKYLGHIDAAKDEGLRSLAYLINKANAEAHKKTQAKAIKLIDLQFNLKSNESIKDIYEYDDNGRTTGYMVRKLNYGKFFEAYNKELKRINKHISKKYNIDLDEDNRIAPEETEARLEWNKMRNQWLSDNCERRFTKEYYDLFNNLSEDTRIARESIQSQIKVLKDKCLSKDGYYHYDKLSDEEWKLLNSLYMQKRQLSSFYDINGRKKIEGTKEYQIAEELQNLNNALYGDNINQAKRDYDAWSKARDKVISECGGMEEMLKGEDGKFDFDTLNKWDERNSKVQLKIGSDGKTPLIWETIDNETYEIPIYEKDGDGGAQYEANQKEISEILKLYRNQNNWDIDPGVMPKSAQIRIKQLEKENRKIKAKAVRRNKELKKVQKQRRSVINKYAQFVPTDAYNRLKRIAERRSFEDPEILSKFMASAGYYYDIGGDELSYRRYSWYSKLKVRKEYEDQFTELVPGDGFLNTDDSNVYKNDKFDEQLAQGSWFIPKQFDSNGKPLYDNSKAYNKVRNSSTLSALYDEIFNTIKEANQNNYKRQNYDDYLLPQITGSLYKRMKNNNWWSSFWSYVRDKVGIGDRVLPDDTEYGVSIEDIVQNIDDLGQIMQNGVQKFENLSRGVRADGRELNFIPMHYTRKLSDPSQLSADLIGITLEYYNNSLKFAEKSAIKDKCESIVDMMKNRKYEKNSVFSIRLSKSEEGKYTINKKGTPILGDQSVTYQSAKKFLDMFLYNIKDTNQITIKGRTFNLGKIASLWRSLTRAINLGSNPIVAFTGLFTSLFSHQVNMLTGQKYNTKDAIMAAREFILHMGGILGSISNKRSGNKVVLLAEMFNIGERGTKKYKNTNRYRIANIVNDNHTYGFLSVCDFVIKSQIMLSELMAYRLYNGRFYNEMDLKINNYNKSKSEVNKILREWRKGVNLYSVFIVKNNRLEIDERYKDQYEEISNILFHRINKHAEAADGMLTETQKSAITTNFLGASVMTHRQYLPQMLQSRFGETVYDLDTQQYDGGIFRTVFNAIFTNVFKAMKVAFKEKSLSKGYRKLIENERDYFYDNSSLQKAAISTVRRKQIRQVSIEAALYPITYLTTMQICRLADEDKKDKLLQFIAYLMLRVQWESYSAYRATDIFNTIRTPSAELGTVDKIEAVANSLIRSIFPNGNLLDTLYSSDLKNSYNETVRRGAYKGWNKSDRDWFKLLFPQHHLYEQYNDSYSKRRYYKNKIMNAEQ